MPDKSILLLVEEEKDINIVSWILEAARYPLERININAFSGKKELERFLEHLPGALVGRCAVLIDLSEKSVREATSRASEQYPKVEVFCAVPEVEAWLFADERAALENASSELGREVISTLLLPEEIASPKEMAQLVFGKNLKSWEFLKQVDITRAAARSPSLRQFLTGLSELLSMEPTAIVESVARSISQEVFAGLVSEVVPADTVIWRTANGKSFTAGELRQHIESGTDIGRQYSSDVLRVARDFLKSMARGNRPETGFL